MNDIEPRLFDTNGPFAGRFAGRYCVVRRIKSGAMGAVYEVVDEKTDTRRALKVMLPEAIEDADLRDRFAQEAKITGHIESDHIVKVLDAGIDEATDMAFLVMELLRGEELGRMVRQRKGLSRDEALVYLRQLAFALDKTHAAGIVHRDLKPDNLFVTTRDDGSPCLKILDFGIAKLLAESQELTGTRPLGTPLYIAPEQATGQGVSPATDRYAFGQIAYTLLVGESYWGSDDAAEGGRESLVARVVLGATEPPSARALRRKNVTLPPRFDEWFFRATNVHPEKRFISGRETMMALTEVFDTRIRAAGPSIVDPSEVTTTVRQAAPVSSPPIVSVPMGVLDEPHMSETNCATTPLARSSRQTLVATNVGVATIVEPSASGPLGGTNMTATSATWTKPLQRRMVPLAVVLGLIVVMGVVGFVVQNGENNENNEEKKKAVGMGSVLVMPSNVPAVSASGTVEKRAAARPTASTDAPALPSGTSSSTPILHATTTTPTSPGPTTVVKAKPSSLKPSRRVLR